MTESPTEAAELRQRVRLAVTKMRLGPQWKPGKGEAHLAKRIERGDLSPGATLADYEAIIGELLAHPTGRVYVFRFAEVNYPTVAADPAGRL